MDIARGEWVEKELDHLIERRAEQRIRENGRTASQDAATAREALWAMSVDRYHQRARRELRARWYSFHADMADLHARLSQEHAHKAEKLCEEGER